jgi:hypothetical protein
VNTAVAAGSWCAALPAGSSRLSLYCARTVDSYSYDHALSWSSSSRRYTEMDPESGLAASAPFGKYWRRHLRPQAVKRDLMLWPPGIVVDHE